MKTLKIGYFGPHVKDLQTKLKKLGYYKSTIDSDFGTKTDKAVKAFQQNTGLQADGIVGKNTWAKIHQLLPKQKLNPDYFTIWLDAGHGGIDPTTGQYTTNGKYYNHKDSSIHIGDGYFYEGYENRIVAQMAEKLLKENDINVVRLYHDYQDTPLSSRVSVVNAMSKVGYYGWMHSIHSNAISTSYSKEKLNSTQGGIIFTSKGQNNSDNAANILYNEWNKVWHKKRRLNGMPWLWGVDSDGDIDREANFYMLRNTESNLVLSTLSEFGFFTSHPDTEFITRPDTRYWRAYCILQAGLKIKEQFKKMNI